MKKTDRRIVKTKRQLREGLIHLMEQKSIQRISVREITEYVDMNRGTFYLHYQDINDMVDKIEDEVFSDFDEMLNSRTLAQLDNKPLLLLEDAFGYLADNARLASAFLGPNGDIAFLEKLKDLVKERCISAWTEAFNDEPSNNHELISSFIASGIIGMIKQWIDSGLVKSPEEMAVLTNDFLLNGVLTFRRSQ